MNSTRSFALAGLWFAMLWVAGCGSKAANCPPCAPGYHCDATTGGNCVSDGSGRDAAMPDLAMGTCVPVCAANQFCNAMNKCVACLSDDNCPVGRICKAMPGGGALCVAGCSDDSRCHAGGGGGDGAIGPQECCSGACADTSSDPLHCGSCGKACSVAHATPACQSGQCKLATCDHDWGDCNGDPADGCETNLVTDAKNCGACGAACAFPNAQPACAAFGVPDGGDNGGCYIAACHYGFDDCDGDPTNGCEASVTSDPINCGACGTKCPSLPHSKLTCANATCALTSCDIGFADCNKDAQDGCETTLTTDAKNCGACGTSCGPGLICVGGGCTCPQCNIPNASAKCINNQCIFDKCNPGFADCNGKPADGCEVNLNFDPANCGSCGVVCPMNTPSCGGGTCTTLYTFSGVKQSLPVMQLAGWTQCYKDTYANDGTMMAQVLAGCSKARLLIACRMTGANTLTLAAMGARADVLFPVPPNSNVTHQANGVEWYYSDSWSWGFAPAGDMVMRNSCDIGVQTDADLRMCWHTGGGQINTGYRCGQTTLNGDATYERLIFHAD